MESKRLTAREFVLDSSKCPVCGCQDVEWDTLTVEVNSTYQEARCSGCEARFSTVSRLVGYLVVGDEEPTTIAEDFGEIAGKEEPRNSLWDELFKAHGLIRRLAKLVRYYGYKQELPDLRTNERAAPLRKGKP